MVFEKFKKMKNDSTGTLEASGLMSKWISKITKPLSNFELNHEQRREIEALEEQGLDNKTHLNIIFNILSSYLRHLSQFGVTLDVSKGIILYF